MTSARGIFRGLIERPHVCPMKIGAQSSFWHRRGAYSSVIRTVPKTSIERKNAKHRCYWWVVALLKYNGKSGGCLPLTRPPRPRALLQQALRRCFSRGETMLKCYACPARQKASQQCSCAGKPIMIKKNTSTAKAYEYAKKVSQTVVTFISRTRRHK